MVADELDYVVGVDTHLDEHVLAVVASPSGAVIAQRSVAANARGYASALRLVRELADGARVWAIEGTGSYGAGLARYLVALGESVLETSRVPQTERRLRGKDDALDAVRTARAALASETLALPRRGERREALRLLLVARRSAVDVRREALGQLRAVIVTAPDGLREELRTLPVVKLLNRCSRLRRSRTMSTEEVATRLVLRSLAHRIQAATVEAAELERELLGHVRALAPRLLDEPGVGPIVAAQLLVAWSHRGRLRSEALHRSLPRAARRQFRAYLADRRPLLTGGESIFTPISFTSSGRQLTASVDAASLGDPPSFGLRVLTVFWKTSSKEATGFAFADVLPDANRRSLSGRRRKGAGS